MLLADVEKELIGIKPINIFKYESDENFFKVVTEIDALFTFMVQCISTCRDGEKLNNQASELLENPFHINYKIYPPISENGELDVSEHTDLVECLDQLEAVREKLIKFF